MTRTVSMRIDENLYNSLSILAKAENRSISNLIETATMRYIEEVEHVDEFEMESIQSNEDLLARLEKGISDAHNQRGRFV